MAAPLIRGTTVPVIATAGTSPAGTQVNDLVLVWYWTQGTAIPGHAVDSGNGFVEILSISYNDGTTDGRLSCAYKVALLAGAQTYTAYTITNGTASQTSVGIEVLQRGTYDIGSLPTSASATLTTTVVPDPPSIASLTGDFLIYATAGWHVTTGGATVVTAGANYTNLAQNGAASHVTHLAWASRARTGLSAASEDPPAFGDNVTPNGSASMTFAIKGRSAITGTGATASTAEVSASAGTVRVAGSSATSASAQTSASSGGPKVGGAAATSASAQVSAS